ncbi:hypothetical protein BDBG_09155 [Blastomyces gilchristii SLH14081]|uniref:Cyclase n=1 Tax=Blastomyces gilchristii (strain SLH14081) TaxID=559298 RepID=A0A179V178_BLAGS|nr:uncharacterized protein BDBG_09155 [Blastomyces gilchristii SLH14081]OAT14065.1 hypothetical protein BDBG_09155 [Blastomyces gilchristii SLH14081]
MTGRPANLPKFTDVPLNKGDPPFSAWGLYGKDDQLGCLNRQTDTIVVEAVKEIKTGVRVSLNWPLDAQSKVHFFSRQVFHKQIIDKSPRTVNDDFWTFNTQRDGLRHFGYQKEKRFYNGVTMEDIHRSKDTEIFKRTSIPLKYLQGVAESQGTEINFGDILIIRVGRTMLSSSLHFPPMLYRFMTLGYMKAFNQLSMDELEKLAKQNPSNLIGVERSEEVLEWIWENFSAVAGDHLAFEAYPPPKDWSMHGVLLAGWGCPIGELFDLDKLAEECERQNRWSFLVSSEMCNVPGGVAR